MIFEIYAVATIAITIGSFVYHRWIKDQPRVERPSDIDLPRVDEGTVIPLIYGRCRVRAPVMVFAGVFLQQGEDEDDRYSVDLMFVIGIPFRGGSALPFNSGIFAGDVRLPVFYGSTGDHFFFLDIVGPDDISVRGEFFTGSPTQNIGDPNTITQKCMVDAAVDPTLIPGYRNFVCCAFVSRPQNHPSGDVERGLRTPSPTVPSFSFEVRTLSTGTESDMGQSLTDDADPAAVLHDLLTSPFGKIGLPTSRLDLASFQAASLTLFNEGHGFSRAFEQGDDAANMIGEVLRQTDGLIYEEPTTGQIVYRLVRNDYDVNDLDDINPDNARPTGDGWYSVQGWGETYNQVRLTFSDRDNNYQDGLAIGQNIANVSLQGGRIRAIDLHMPGICTKALAQKVASRELAAVSQPLAKASMIVDRSFYEKRPGDVVTLTWPELGIDKMVMRIVRVDLGTLGDGLIRLDMMRDIFDVSVGAFSPQ